MRARGILHLVFLQEKLQWRSLIDKFPERMKRFLLTKTKEANWTESITCERFKLEAVIWTGAKSRWVQAHASSRRNTSGLPVTLQSLPKLNLRSSFPIRSEIEAKQSGSPHRDHLIDFIDGKANIVPPPAPRKHCQANQKDQCLSKRRRKFEITLVLFLECLG